MIYKLGLRLGPSHAKSIQGRCLCGAVRYEVELETGPRPGTRSVWERTVRPNRFRLLSGHDMLSGHQFAAEDAQHFFCEGCGVRSFTLHGVAGLEPHDGRDAYYSVDLKCLERTNPAAAWPQPLVRGGRC